ncbi:DUF945 family protein [Pseudomonas sp. N040]|uniref:DUF945 family protein n=1 Tax=Pseudomonas sp. N040 TaxID=2785325 RepID=UPI0018A29EF8|nr:DUF945 family protein [Pseudomonas sp. N040]MBF7729666.1 DUF945 family protein [Pseudomonas sp. N040]MBW7013308.1 YdgA family protein [Pseudomonas sp. N040]
MLNWLRKPRTWAWLAGLFVLLVVGVAGLTGVLLRQQLAPLQATPVQLENGARLSVQELHGGWFSTRAILRLDWPLDAGRQLVLRVANDIGHGPFPADRLAQFDLRPALLTDRLRLLDLQEHHSEQQQALPAEFSGNLRLSYLGHLQTDLQGATPRLPLGVWQLAVSDLQLAVDASLDSLDLQLTTQQFELQQGGAPLLRLTGVEQQVQLDGDATTAALALQLSAGELALWGQPVGQLSQQLTAEGVSLAAVAQAFAGQTQAWATALPPASHVQGTLLALSNADGRSGMQLDKAVGPQPLTVKANLSRTMFLGALEDNAALRGQGQTIARQQAMQFYGFVSQPLLQTGLFASSADGLRAELELDERGLRSTLPTTFLSQNH